MTRRKLRRTWTTWVLVAGGIIGLALTGLARTAHAQSGTDLPFFADTRVKPNVLLILDNSQSMLHSPTDNGTAGSGDLDINFQELSRAERTYRILDHRSGQGAPGAQSAGTGEHSRMHILRRVLTGGRPERWAHDTATNEDIVYDDSSCIGRRSNPLFCTGFGNPLGESFVNSNGTALDGNKYNFYYVPSSTGGYSLVDFIAPLLPPVHLVENERDFLGRWRLGWRSKWRTVPPDIGEFFIFFEGERTGNEQRGSGVMSLSEVLLRNNHTHLERIATDIDVLGTGRDRVDDDGTQAHFHIWKTCTQDTSAPAVAQCSSTNKVISFNTALRAWINDWKVDPFATSEADHRITGSIDIGDVEYDPDGDGVHELDDDYNWGGSNREAGLAMKIHRVCANGSQDGINKYLLREGGACPSGSEDLFVLKRAPEAGTYLDRGDPPYGSDDPDTDLPGTLGLRQFAESRHGSFASYMTDKLGLEDVQFDFIGQGIIERDNSDSDHVTEDFLGTIDSGGTYLNQYRAVFERTDGVTGALIINDTDDSRTAGERIVTETTLFTREIPPIDVPANSSPPSAGNPDITLQEGTQRAFYFDYQNDVSGAGAAALFDHMLSADGLNIANLPFDYWDSNYPGFAHPNAVYDTESGKAKSGEVPNRWGYLGFFSMMRYTLLTRAPIDCDSDDKDELFTPECGLGIMDGELFGDKVRFGLGLFDANGINTHENRDLHELGDNWCNVTSLCAVSEQSPLNDPELGREGMNLLSGFQSVDPLTGELLTDGEHNTSVQKWLRNDVNVILNMVFGTPAGEALQDGAHYIYTEDDGAGPAPGTTPDPLLAGARKEDNIFMETLAPVFEDSNRALMFPDSTELELPQSDPAVQNGCRRNFIILLTDGAQTGANTMTTSNLMEQVTLGVVDKDEDFFALLNPRRINLDLSDYADDLPQLAAGLEIPLPAVPDLNDGSGDSQIPIKVFFMGFGLTNNQAQNNLRDAATAAFIDRSVYPNYCGRGTEEMGAGMECEDIDWYDQSFGPACDNLLNPNTPSCDPTRGLNTNPTWASDEERLKRNFDAVLDAIVAGAYTRAPIVFSRSGDLAGAAYFEVDPRDVMWRGHYLAFAEPGTVGIVGNTPVPEPADGGDFIEVWDAGELLSGTTSTEVEGWPGLHGGAVSISSREARTAGAANERLIYAMDTSASPPTTLEVSKANWATFQPLFQGTCGNCSSNFPTDQTETEFVIDFLRSENNPWFGTDTSKSDPALEKEWRFGAPIHSIPQLIASPSPSIFEAKAPGYVPYKVALNDRPELAYMTAQDGMLHAFFMKDPDGLGGPLEAGDEAFAYIPRQVMDKFPILLETQIIVLDGTPTVEEVFIDAETDNDSDLEWRTVLISGYRSAGRGFFALDVTLAPAPAQRDYTNAEVPADWFADTTSGNPNTYLREVRPMWELDESNAPADYADTTTPPASHVGRFGESWGRAAIARVKLDSGDKFVAFLPGGFSTDPDEGNFLYVADVETGNELVSGGTPIRFEIPDLDAVVDGSFPYPYSYSADTYSSLQDNIDGPDDANDNHLASNLFTIDYDPDGYHDALYFGDIQGRVWKLNISASDPTDWVLALFYDPADPDGNGVDPSLDMLFYNSTQQVQLKGPVLDNDGSGTVDSLDVRQPVFFRPTVFHDQESGDNIVYFGTGNLDIVDNEDIGREQNWFHAVKDEPEVTADCDSVKCDASYGNPLGDTWEDVENHPDLEIQALHGDDETLRSPPSGAEDDNTAPEFPVLLTDGERLTSAPVIDTGTGDVILFTTYAPFSIVTDITDCSQTGSAFLFCLDGRTGHEACGVSFVTTNDDGEEEITNIDTADRERYVGDYDQLDIVDPDEPYGGYQKEDLTKSVRLGAGLGGQITERKDEGCTTNVITTGVGEFEVSKGEGKNCRTGLITRGYAKGVDFGSMSDAIREAQQP